MNYSEDAYHSYGTKWLKFLTFFYFPGGTIRNLFSLITHDYSSMSTIGRSAFVCNYLFYSIIFAFTAWHLFKRTAIGYYLSFLSLFSVVISCILLSLLASPLSLPSESEFFSVIVLFAVGIVNYIYMKRRRVLFISPEIGSLSFQLLGQRILSLMLLSVLSLYSFFSIAVVEGLENSNAANSQLQSDYDAISAELETANANLDALTNQRDLFQWLYDDREKYETFMNDCVRFVTEHGEKYHLYDCSVIENADNIYYFFVDDLETLDYKPCSLCNPSP